jgi:hypothetical protein
MIDVFVEVFRTAEIWSSTEEDSAIEPFGSIVAVRCTVIGRSLIISVRTHRRAADADGDVIRATCNEKCRGENQQDRQARSNAHKRSTSRDVMTQAVTAFQE